MKIIHLITALQLGGAEKVAIDISKKLNSEEFNISLITIFKDNSKFSKNLKTELNDQNISYKEFGIQTRLKKIKYIGMIISIIQLFFFSIRQKPDIIHSHTDLPDFVLSNVLRLFSVFNIKKPKVIRTIHNTQLWPTHKKIACYVEKKFNDDYVVFISKGARKAYFDLRETCDLPISNNNYFINNGVDLLKYTDKCNSSILQKHNIGIDISKINYLFVGRFVEQKGFDLLLKAIKSIEPKLLSRIHIYAFGEGHLKQLLSNPEFGGLPISTYPPTTDICFLYGCFDYLTMPSRFEGLPLVALEAHASKLPVIASNAPGLKEAIPKNWPLLFENKDIMDLKRILIKTITRNVDNKNLGEIAYGFVENNFSLRSTVLAYERVYYDTTNK